MKNKLENSYKIKIGGSKMLDIKRIRENLEDIKKAMDRRGEKEFDLDAVVALDDKRRELLKEVEVMKNELNVESKKIPQLIKEGKDVTADKARLKELSFSYFGSIIRNTTSLSQPLKELIVDILTVPLFIQKCSFLLSLIDL